MIGERLAPPSALNRAQSWLRDATNSDLLAYVESAVADARIASHLAEQIARELSADELRRSRNSTAVQWIAPVRTPGQSEPDKASQRSRPYAHPYFWAGFVYTGL